MNVTIREWQKLSLKEKNVLLLRSEQDIRDVSERVGAIIEEVRTGGDAALERLTKKFDKVDISGMPIEVQPDEYEEAERRLPGEDP